jgi:spermidine synthase
VVLVDIDPSMTRLAKTYPALVHQNANSLADPRVEVVHDDAYKYLEKGSELFSVIIGDLPDPNHEALAKLYSREFYGLIRRRLAVGGIFVTQATSPLMAREAFWCVNETVRHAGFATTPFHVYVPSFGDWGFIIGRSGQTAPDLSQVNIAQSGLPLRYLHSLSPTVMTAFDADTNAVPVEPSTLDFPRILRLYEQGVKRWE